MYNLSCIIVIIFNCTHAYGQGYILVINLNYKPLNLKGGNRQIIDNSKIN